MLEGVPEFATSFLSPCSLDFLLFANPYPPTPHTLLPRPWVIHGATIRATTVLTLDGSTGHVIASQFSELNPLVRFACMFVGLFVCLFARIERSRQPRNVRLVIHPAIPTEGRPIKEVMAEARRAVGDGLEDWQKPMPDAAVLSPPPSPPSPPPSR